MKIQKNKNLDQFPKLTISQYRADNRHDLPTTKTPCHYGGHRYWFVCECGKRVGVLYFSQDWHCRHCMGYLYRTQLVSTLDRLNKRINRIRGRLGWVHGIAHGKGNKPKGMHHATFRRLCAEHDRLANDIIVLINKRLKA